MKKNIFIAIVILYSFLLIGCIEKGVSKNTVYVVNKEDDYKEFAKKVSQIDIDSADLGEITKTLGEPVKYIWEEKTFNREDLPHRYIMVYSEEFHIYMIDKKIQELRFYGPSFIANDSLHVGLKLDEVIKIIGEPRKIVVKEKCEYENGVLYKDILGNRGYCYYQRLDKNVRVFFRNYEVSALYYTSSNYPSNQ